MKNIQLCISYAYTVKIDAFITTEDDFLVSMCNEQKHEHVIECTQNSIVR